MTFHELEGLAFSYWNTADQLKSHIYERSRTLYAANDARRDTIQSVEALQQRQQECREYFIECLGGLPDSSAPLNAVTTGVVEEDGYRIEKVIFQSRPQHYVTANLYLPDGLTEPAAAVLFLCGHSAIGKAYEAYQNVCQTLVKAGLIVLAQDPVGQGERLSYYEPSLGAAAIAPCCPDHDYIGEQCRLMGWNVARYFLHDAMRSVDYLCSRPEVDNARIGITGNSGGGTQTSMMMLADPRIAAAAPGTFIMNRELYQQTGQAQDAEQIWPGFTAAGYDHEDILLAMAPRPVCVLAVKSDFFPIESTRRTVERSRHAWEMYERGDALELVEDHSVHGYTLNLARAAARFFSRHLNGEEVVIEGDAPVPLPEKQLWCTTTGQVRAEFADARIVHDEILEECKQFEVNATAQAESVAWLREKVYAHRTECELNPRFYGSLLADELRVDMAFWWSQPGIVNQGYLFRSATFDGKTLPVTIGLWDKGTQALQAHSDWIRQTCHAGRAVLVVNLTGVGLLEPNAINVHLKHTRYGTFHKLADDLVWLNDSLAALRVYDLLRVLPMIREWQRQELLAENVEIYAPGRMGIYARMAALLEKEYTAVGLDANSDLNTIVGSRYYNDYDVKSFVIPGAASNLS